MYVSFVFNDSNPFSLTFPLYREAMLRSIRWRRGRDVPRLSSPVTRKVDKAAVG